MLGSEKISLEASEVICLAGTLSCLFTLNMFVHFKSDCLLLRCVFTFSSSGGEQRQARALPGAEDAIGGVAG